MGWGGALLSGLGHVLTDVIIIVRILIKEDIGGETHEFICEGFDTEAFCTL